MELISIHLYLDKVSGRYYLRVASLSKQHAINSLLNDHHSKEAKLHWLAIDNFTEKQRLKIKSFIVDTNNYLDEIYSFFNRLYRKLLSGFCLCDNLSNCFSFHKVDKKKPENICNHLKSLDELLFNSFLNPNMVIIIADTSIRNNIATSVSYIFSWYGNLSKIIYHAFNITLTEAKLIAIRCGINRPIQVSNVNKIIVIMDTIHATKCIFNSSVHLYQLHLIVVLQDL